MCIVNILRKLYYVVCIPEEESIVSAISARSFLMLLLVGFMVIDAGICGKLSATFLAI